MYADRYARPEGIKPGSLAIALAINGGLIALLLLSAPVATAIKDKILEVRNIPLAHKPEPVPPRADPHPQQKTIAKPQPEEPLVRTPIAPEAPNFPPPYPPGPTGDGGGVVDIAPLPPLPLPPVLTEATVDPRFAAVFQPEYPAGERRAEQEGTVVIRVLIGVDGRVKRTERIAAASDAFWRATEQRALTRWHFRPATRDGVPVEAWRTMTVRFEMAI